VHVSGAAPERPPSRRDRSGPQARVSRTARRRGSPSGATTSPLRAGSGDAARGRRCGPAGFRLTACSYSASDPPAPERRTESPRRGSRRAPSPPRRIAPDTRSRARRFRLGGVPGSRRGPTRQPRTIMSTSAPRNGAESQREHAAHDDEHRSQQPDPRRHPGSIARLIWIYPIKAASPSMWVCLWTKARLTCTAGRNHTDDRLLTI
jgi:hypothetical protein